MNYAIANVDTLGYLEILGVIRELCSRFDERLAYAAFGAGVSLALVTITRCLRSGSAGLSALFAVVVAVVVGLFHRNILAAAFDRGDFLAYGASFVGAPYAGFVAVVASLGLWPVFGQILDRVGNACFSGASSSQSHYVQFAYAVGGIVPRVVSDTLGLPGTLLVGVLSAIGNLLSASASFVGVWRRCIARLSVSDVPVAQTVDMKPDEIRHVQAMDAFQRLTGAIESLVAVRVPALERAMDGSVVSTPEVQELIKGAFALVYSDEACLHHVACAIRVGNYLRLPLHAFLSSDGVHPALYARGTSRSGWQGCVLRMENAHMFSAAPLGSALKDKVDMLAFKISPSWNGARALPVVAPPAAGTVVHTVSMESGNPVAYTGTVRRASGQLLWYESSTSGGSSGSPVLYVTTDSFGKMRLGVCALHLGTSTCNYGLILAAVQRLESNDNVAEYDSPVNIYPDNYSKPLAYDELRRFLEMTRKGSGDVSSWLDAEGTEFEDELEAKPSFSETLPLPPLPDNPVPTPGLTKVNAECPFVSVKVSMTGTALKDYLQLNPVTLDETPTTLCEHLGFKRIGSSANFGSRNLPHSWSDAVTDQSVIDAFGEGVKDFKMPARDAKAQRRSLEVSIAHASSVDEYPASKKTAAIARVIRDLRAAMDPGFKYNFELLDRVFAGEDFELSPDLYASCMPAVTFNPNSNPGLRLPGSKKKEYLASPAQFGKVASLASRLVHDIWHGADTVEALKALSDQASVFIKNEPHKSKKCAEGRYRLIVSVPMVVELAAKMILGQVHAALKACHDRSPVRTGAGNTPDACAALWKHLLANGVKYVMSGDAVAWDWSMPAHAVDAVAAVYAELIKPGDSEFLAFMRKFYTTVYTGQLVLADGSTYQQDKPAVQRSGWPDTTMGNSIAGAYIQRLVISDNLLLTSANAGDDFLLGLSDSLSAKAYTANCARAGINVDDLVLTSVSGNMAVEFCSHYYHSDGSLVPTEKSVFKAVARFCALVGERTIGSNREVLYQLRRSALVGASMAQINALDDLAVRCSSREDGLVDDDVDECDPVPLDPWSASRDNGQQADSQN